MARIALTVAALLVVIAACAIGVGAANRGGAKRAPRKGKDAEAPGKAGALPAKGGDGEGAGGKARRGRRRKDGDEPSSQDACLADRLEGGTLVQKDGTAVSYVKVYSKNNSLLSPRELVAEVESTARAIATVGHPFKIIHIQVPVDTSANLRRMDEVDARYQARIRELPGDAAGRRARRQLDARRGILASYRARAEAEAKASDKMRPETYVVVPATAEEGGAATSARRAEDLRAALKANGFDSRVLDGAGTVALLLAFDEAHRTPRENLEPYAGFPVVPEVIREMNGCEDGEGEK